MLPAGEGGRAVFEQVPFAVQESGWRSLDTSAFAGMPEEEPEGPAEVVGDAGSSGAPGGLDAGESSRAEADGFTGIPSRSGVTLCHPVASAESGNASRSAAAFAGANSGAVEAASVTAAG